MPPKLKNNIKNWVRAVVRLIVQTHLKSSRSYILTDYRKPKKREADGSLQFAEIAGIQAPKAGFVVPISCQVMLIYVVFLGIIIP